MTIAIIKQLEQVVKDARQELNAAQTALEEAGKLVSCHRCGVEAVISGDCTQLYREEDPEERDVALLRDDAGFVAPAGWESWGADYGMGSWQPRTWFCSEACRVAHNAFGPRVKYLKKGDDGFE